MPHRPFPTAFGRAVPCGSPRPASRRGVVGRWGVWFVAAGLAWPVAPAALAQGAPAAADAPPAAASTPSPAASQRPEVPAEGRGGGGGRRPAPVDGDRRLPEERSTRHSLELPAAADPAGLAGPGVRLERPARTLRFTARAGALPALAEDGALLGEIGFIAYTLDAPEGASASAPAPASTRRPVTFAINGGPGASSAWLQLGAMGPWRVRMDGEALHPSASPELLPNGETWLDATDLVFLDPVGTGFSPLLDRGDAARNRLFSVNGDVEVLADAIRRWLERAGRLGSPVHLVGESYGGYRAPRIAYSLQRRHAVGLSGITLVSPVLDFSLLRSSRHNVMAWAAQLPSLAASAATDGAAPAPQLPAPTPVTPGLPALPAPPAASPAIVTPAIVPPAAAGAPLPAILRAAEDYAAGEYLLDLTRGEGDGAALDRMSGRVAALTGLDPALVRRLAGRVDASTFRRERRRALGTVSSAYDGAVFSLDPSPGSAFTQADDPFLDGLNAPMTSAMMALYEKLNWRPDLADTRARYRLLNRAVSGAWEWGRGQPEAMGDLRGALALDPGLRVQVVHGASDLVTPYFASVLLLRQLPVSLVRDRVAFRVFPGGHMFYSRDDARAAFAAMGAQLVAEDGR